MSPEGEELYMAEKVHRPHGSSGTRFWVLQQHDEVTIVQAQEKPSVTVEPGERMKRVRGPYRSREDAEIVRAKLDASTLAAQNGRR